MVDVVVSKCDFCSSVIDKPKSKVFVYDVDMLLSITSSIGETRIIHNKGDNKRFCDGDCFIRYVKEIIGQEDPSVSAIMEKGIK